jgi:lipopolysaccharide transport system permease protein/teichoic acid transport system permease protein
LLAFFRTVYSRSDFIWAMAVRDFRTKYVGTLGGVLWIVLEPLALVATFWFAFTIGLKVTGPAGMPFAIYFVTGLVPWLFFSETVGANTNMIIANAHLVKKTKFPTEILPFVSILSSAFTHAILLVIVIAMLWIYGYRPTFHIVEVVPLFLLLSAFITGLSWLLSALNVFHRDLGHAVTMVVNLWFWLTPIAWNADAVPAEWRWVAGYNPMHYVIEGYRRAMVYGQPALDVHGALFLLGVTAVVIAWGGYVFRRLKNEFADVI